MTTAHTQPDSPESSIRETPHRPKTRLGRRRRALVITAEHTAANMLVGAVPIPFSDAPILVVSEGILVARILSVYNFRYSLASLAGIATGLGGTLLSRVGAMMAAGNVLKLAPGPGSAVGGMTNAMVAGGVTAVLGLATIAVCERAQRVTLHEGTLDLQDFLHDLDRELGEAFKSAFKKMNGGTDPLDIVGMA